MSEQLPEQENPYVAPDIERKDARLQSFWRCNGRWLSAICLLTGLCALMAITRSFRHFFVEFDVELPVLARVAFSPWSLFATFLLLVLTLAKKAWWRTSRWNAAWDLVAIWIAIGGGMLYLLAILLPFLSVVRALSE